MTDIRANFQRRQEGIDPRAFVADNATVIGDVLVGADSSVWYGAVVRGDSERIQIGRRTNVQDLCVLHADPGFPCVLGDDVSVGHGAIVHGAVVEDQALIGMRAVVMNGARIGQGSLIGVGTVITEGTVIPPGSVVLGLPGKVVRAVDERDRKRMAHAARHYAELTQALKRGAAPEA